jgi:hypothetical protein
LSGAISNRIVTSLKPHYFHQRKINLPESPSPLRGIILQELPQIEMALCESHLGRGWPLWGELAGGKCGPKAFQKKEGR